MQKVYTHLTQRYTDENGQRLTEQRELNTDTDEYKLGDTDEGDWQDTGDDDELMMVDMATDKLRENKRHVTNAEFRLHDFSPDFGSPTGFEKSPTNARNHRQIGARSREWQSRSVNEQRRDLRESPTSRRRPWDIWHAKYLDLSAIQNPAVWKVFWLKTTSAMTDSQWESQIQSSGEFGEEL